MRITAGVLVLIAALINLMAGFGWLIAGAVAAQANDISDALKEEMDAESKEDKELDALHPAATANSDSGNAAEAAEAAEDEELDWTGIIEERYGFAIFLGFFLLVVAGLQIAAGILLFASRSKVFVFVTSGLALLGEAGGIWMSSVGISNLFCGGAAVLAIVAAARMVKEAQGPQVNVFD